MKIINNSKKLSILALSLISSGLVQATESKAEYIDIMNQTARLIEERIAELNKMAVDEKVLLTAEEANFDLSRRPIFSNDKYLSINGIIYPVTINNTVSAPFRHWSDESAMRNLFSFLGEDWELSWYSGGITFVNKKFGNYDYGNGCLLEYYPMAENIPNEYINRDFGLVRELESCFDGSMGDIPNYEAERTNPHHYGVHAQYANFVSIEKYNNQIITAHSPRSEYGDIANPVIGFYDGGNQVKDMITAISKGRPYQQIDDISVHGTKLFVSAVSAHNRIDIFDLETKEYQYSLGIKHNGNAKIKVSDEFIFVTGKQGIAVYQNVVAKKYETKVLTPFTMLTETQAHSIENVGNTLIAFTDTSYSVFNIANMEHGVTKNPVMVGQVGFSAVDLEGNTLITKQGSRVATYDVNQFIANGYSFNEAAKGIYLVDGQEVFAKDFLLTEQGFIALTDSVTSNVHTINAVTFTPNVSVTETRLEFSTLPTTARVQQVLQEGLTEGIDTLKANTRSLIHTRLVDGNTVEITNYTSVDVVNLAIDITAKDQYNWARLGSVDFLPAYTRITLPLTYFNAEKRFNTVNGSGVYDYSGMLSTMKGHWGTYGEKGTQHIFTSRFTTSTQHPLLTKLETISANWDIDFIERTIFNPKEKDWNAESAKRHLELITNMAYVFSSETFKNKLMNYKATYGHDLQIASQVLRTQSDYDDFLQVNLNENGFSNVAKLNGFEASFGIVGQRGTTFGVSDAEMDRIDSGDYQSFARIMAEQLVSNYFLDCVPRPCNWTEPHLTRLIMDVFEELSIAGELPY
ncbi:hypothetical protein VOA_002279 [Vibrio sp. RC586]|uniref:hypothetical protein n=1 Tax=Vibrio sp. RC586 TaxID=675815 RepID=UPI0001BB7D4C|nr:hypothetical protein [Vibrio sp. RC586]EEY98459.1 hypothetical protein VOA_002279 [Vibrio sp. RC586]